MPAIWTDPESLKATPDTEGRSADFNSALDDLLWLYRVPQIAVRLTGSQAVADSTDHTISFDEAVWVENGDGVSTLWSASSPTKIVVPRAGVYAFHCSVLWDETQDSSKRSIFLEVTDSTGTVRRRGVQLPSVDPTEIILSGETNLEADSSLEFVVRQLSGASLNMMATNNRTVTTVRWVGAPQDAT